MNREKKKNFLISFGILIVPLNRENREKRIEILSKIFLYSKTPIDFCSMSKALFT